jgi:hypothetical protein
MNSLLFVFKLNISLIDVHAITLKRRLNRLVDYSFKRKKGLKAFVKMNMANLILHAAVRYYF